MPLKVVVDKERCISSGKCVVDAASGFQFDGDELAEVRPGAAVLAEDRLRQIARNCPGEAIHVFTEEGSRIALG